jgi:glycine/D-amino acid oxidase-like deaminating enzyme/nitrite reductase/ring-hydroxylating ferredoxin subunit
MSESVWFGTVEAPAAEPLAGDTECDVAIVGAGITGMVTADLVSSAGKRVLVLDMLQSGEGETGHTTAHLTEMFDQWYRRVVRDFSKEEAGLIARASRAAIDWIAKRSTELGGCGFDWVDGWLYDESGSDLDKLKEEVEAAIEAGIRASYHEQVPLPFPVAGGVRFERQAQFHPLEFLFRLIRDLKSRGVEIYSGTRVTNVEEENGHCLLETERGTVRAAHAVFATNVPVIDRLVMQTKLYAYRTYAIAVPAVAGDPEGLFYDTMEPYHYTRRQKIDERSWLIVGGEDHRTGTETDTEKHYAALGAYVAERFGSREIAYRWSGQVIETPDGLPFIGRNPGADRVWIATGFAGQGFTMGVAAAGLISNLIEGRENPLESLFDPSRVKPIAGGKRYVTENLEFPLHFLKDRLSRTNVDAKSLDEVGVEEGKIVKVGGRKLAAYRNEQGELHLMSTVCPHMGCDVRWNRAESSWDCPCHGSRFSPQGEVLNGPARSGLTRVEDGEGGEQ